ncbi:MAG TPA: HlyD family efflux transporter periplasmic adaptor subunit [Anaerolineales bacterium]|nr:HlyD family efflux transporter periplasmic adaptor subunit [Anaerolineales bacterium]
MKSQVAVLTVLMMIAMLITSACGGSAVTTQTTATPTGVADDVIVAEGRVEPVRYARIAFSISSTVSEVLVKEGQAVEKGQPLIRLGDESDTNYSAAQVELVSAEKALNDLKNSASTDLAKAIIDLKDAREEYDDAVDYLKYLQNNKKIPQTQTRRVWVKTSTGYKYETRTKDIKGPAPEDWIIEAENDVALKKAKVDELQRTYDRLKGGVDAEQLTVLEARLNAAKASVAAFSITAPFDGIVADLGAKLGNSIKPGEPVVTIADYSYWVVKTTDLTELDVVKLKEGQPVTVTLDAIRDADLAGTIDSIGQKVSENQGDVVYEVTVMLADRHPAMRWGMTAKVNFQ